MKKAVVGFSNLTSNEKLKLLHSYHSLNKSLANRKYYHIYICMNLYTYFICNAYMSKIDVWFQN